MTAPWVPTRVSDLEDAYPSNDEVLGSPLTVVCLGDSTTLGGSPVSDGGTPYPTQLQRAFPSLLIVNEGVGGATAAGVLAHYQGLPGYLRGASAIIMAGRNDILAIAAAQTSAAAVVASVRAIVAALGHTRYLVLSPWNTDGEGSGVPIHDAGLVPLKQALAAEFGGRYIDAHEALLGHATLPGDAAAVAADITPPSLRQGTGDPHLNTAGYAVVAGLCTAFCDGLTVAPLPLSQANLAAALAALCARPQDLGTDAPKGGSFAWVQAPRIVSIAPDGTVVAILDASGVNISNGRLRFTGNSEPSGAGSPEICNVPFVGTVYSGGVHYWVGDDLPWPDTTKFGFINGEGLVILGPATATAFRPVSPPVLSYSRAVAGETPAGAAMRQALAAIGLVTDSTTA